MILPDAFWPDLLKAVLTPILTMLVLIGTAYVVAALSFGTKWLTTWLDTHQRVQESKAVAAASTIVQTAMSNAAGMLALSIQQGKVDVTDPKAVLAAAAEEAARVLVKVPDAIAVLRPAEGAIVEGITGKLGNLIAVAPIVINQPAPVAAQ